MYPCPDCHEGLAEARDQNGTTYRCTACSGEAATVFRMRQLVGTEMTESMARLAEATKIRCRRRCPVCEKRMLEIPLSAGEENFEIEHCSQCAMFWLDSGDMERLPEEAKGVFDHAIDAAETTSDSTRRRVSRGMAGSMSSGFLVSRWNTIITRSHSPWRPGAWRWLAC